MKEALIDTDILSYYLKGDENVIEKIVVYLSDFPTLNISFITYYEILKGLEYKKATKQISNFEDFINQCNLINIDKESIQQSAKIFGHLKSKGISIGTADLLIAGIALQNNFQLITNNTKHFADIENIDLANWKEE